MKRFHVAAVCGFLCGAVGCGDALELGSVETEDVATDGAGLQLIEGVETTPEAGDVFGSALAIGDFNGDGFDDLAIGIPGQTVGGDDDAGVIFVRYGAAQGSPSAQLISQDSPGIQNSAEVSDAFGSALAAGDFNGDGKDDLAIGAPGETVQMMAGAGLVNVLYGSASGLSSTGDQVLYQGLDGLGVGINLTTPEVGDGFGGVLVAGDFNADGKDDLAIAATGEGVGSDTGTGAVHVVAGSPTGLAPAVDVGVLQGEWGFAGTRAPGEYFGTSLAAGDLDADGKDDLVVGIPGEPIGGTPGSGAIHVLFGSSSLIDTSRDLQLSQDSPGIAGGSEGVDYFGFSVACGDFDGDSFADIAVGAPSEDVGVGAPSGSVNIIFGSEVGPTATGNYIVHQNSWEVAGTASAGNFGYSLAAGDYDDDGSADLTVGVVAEQVNGVSAGAVYVFPGSKSPRGPNGNTEIILNQSLPDVGGPAEEGDFFGGNLATGDFNGDGREDLAISASSESLGALQYAGAAHLLRGSSTGITLLNSLLFTE